MRRTTLTLATLAAPAAAQPGGTLTSPFGASYTQGTAPASETSFNPATFFSPDSGPSQLTQNGWYYRVAGDTRERPFGTYTKSDGFVITGTSSYSGNTSTYNWTENGPSGVRFTATYTTTLNASTLSAASISQAFRITNPNASALTISLFNYEDVDANGTAAGDTATGDVTAITVLDGPWRAVHSAAGPRRSRRPTRASSATSSRTRPSTTWTTRGCRTRAATTRAPSSGT